MTMNDRAKRHLSDIIESTLQDLNLTDQVWEYKMELREQLRNNLKINDDFLTKWYNFIIKYYQDHPRIPNLQNSYYEYFENVEYDPKQVNILYDRIDVPCLPPPKLEPLPNDSGQPGLIDLILQPIYTYECFSCPRNRKYLILAIILLLIAGYYYYN